MSKKYKIAILLGGKSAEREISLKTGNQVGAALESRGHQVKKIDLAEIPIQEILDYQPDVVFIALHGRFGEDGTIQGLLEILGFPYTGSGVLSSALGINKIASKKIFQFEGVMVPYSEIVSIRDYKNNQDAIIQSIYDNIGLPCVVKPACEGSTLGMNIPREKEAINEAIVEAFKYDDELLVEEFIEGTEITVGILGNDDPQALPTLEIVYETEVYDYEAKYTSGMSRHIIPARLPKGVRQRAQNMAIKAHQSLGCSGFSRVDLIVNEKGEPYVLEINTIPGMTKLSLYPDAARAAGIEFPELVEKLVELALEKKQPC